MKRIKNIFVGLLVGACALTFGSCSKSEDEKGPFERAGKAADQAMEKAKEQTGQAMDKAGKALKQAGEKMRESGEKPERQ